MLSIPFLFDEYKLNPIVRLRNYKLTFLLYDLWRVLFVHMILSIGFMVVEELFNEGGIHPGLANVFLGSWSSKKM